MSKIDHSLFSAHEHALEDSFGPCPECGQQLKLKRGKTGAFIGCSDYPTCDYTRPLHDQQISTLKLIDNSHCPECGSQMAIKKGRFGMFIGCSNFPACHHIEKIQQQHDTSVPCPQCESGKLIEKTNRYGKRFFSCDHYPKCRYVVNFEPIAQSCPKCGWGILIKKKGQLSCPQTNCDYKESDTPE